MLLDYLAPYHGLIVKTAFFIMQLALCGLVFLLIENIRPIQKNEAFTTEKWTELGLTFINSLLVVPTAQIVLLFVFTHSLKEWLPYQMLDSTVHTFPLWLQVLVGVVVLDFIVYLRHRFTHRYMWRAHAIHHSAQYINWLTSSRLHPFEIVVDLMFSMAVLHIVGFSGEGIVTAGFVMLFFNLFTHANINFEWPSILRYIIGSPNFHRWHHAKLEKQAFNKNFSVVFPLIDLCLGTFYHPKNQLPSEYGIYHLHNAKPIPPTLKGQLFYPIMPRRNKKS